jgi:hypothetical protein
VHEGRGKGPPIAQHPREHRVDERRKAGVWCDPDNAVHQHEAGDVSCAESLDHLEDFDNPEGPTDQDHGLRPKVAYELVHILCAAIDEVSVADPRRATLRAWVQGDDAVRPGEVAELWLPDISRHRPARDEDDRRPGSRTQVVEPHAIAGDEPLVGHAGECRRLGAGMDRGAEHEAEDELADTVHYGTT